MQTHHATKQRKKIDKSAATAKAYSEGDYVRVFQVLLLPKGTKNSREREGSFMITEVQQD